MARNRESFTGLHNVSKHTLFLQEGAEAMLLTLKSLSRHHERFLEMVPDSDRLVAERAQGMLTHAETQFQSISLRLKSLEKRIQNIIALVCLQYSFISIRPRRQANRHYPDQSPSTSSRKTAIESCKQIAVPWKPLHL